MTHRWAPRLLISLCLLGWAVPGHATIVLVATGGASAIDAGGGSTTAVSAGADTSGATLLVVGCAQYFGGGTSGNVAASDSKGNSYTALTPKPSDSAVSRVALFYVNSSTPTVGASHTFTCSGTETYPIVVYWAFSGTVANPFQQEIADQGGGTDQDSNGGFTPPMPGSVVVSLVGIEGGAVGSLAVTAPLTSSFLKGTGGDGATSGGGAYVIQTTPILANPTFTWTTARTDVAITTASFGLHGGSSSSLLLLGVR